MFAVGQKVTTQFGHKAEVVKVLRNGKVKIEMWVQGGFMTKPELWKDTVRAETLVAA